MPSPRLPTSRRLVLAGLAASAAARPLTAAAIPATAGPRSYLAYVGARTTAARKARGDGVNVFRVDAASGAWSHVQRLVVGENPSFLALSPDGRHLYAAHGDGGEVSAMAAAPDGTLTLINRAATQGKNVAHLAVDPTGRWVVAANHYSSSLAVIPIRADGSLGELTDLVTLTGSVGPRRDEQPYAKPHQVVFDPQGHGLVAPDKGLDRVFSFRLDPEHGRLEPRASPFVALMGSGPRHLAFHPSGRIAYLLCEMASTITTLHYDPASGALKAVQILPSTPDDWVSESRAAEIAVSADGRFVYASNRGHDSIGVFAAAAGSGRLSPVEWRGTAGRVPRNFALSPDGRFLFAGNEDSDTIASFAVDRRTGRLTPHGGLLHIGSPTCIVFRT